MRFLAEKQGLTMIEYIIGGALILAVVGTALWSLAVAIAGRFNSFNNAL